LDSEVKIAWPETVNNRSVGFCYENGTAARNYLLPVRLRFFFSQTYDAGNQIC
jgi:hypothetical protein